MNKFFEFFRALFSLSDEDLESLELSVKNEQKAEDETGKQNNNNEKDKEVKETEKVSNNKENVKTDKKGTGETVKEQTAGASSVSIQDEKQKEADSVSIAEYKKLEQELASVRKILEDTKTQQIQEKRDAKIKTYTDCLDPSLLTTLLDGIDEKDMDAKVEEIKKEKGYLFKSVETKGFNPATPQNTLSNLEAKFYERNPDLKPQ